MVLNRLKMIINYIYFIFILFYVSVMWRLCAGRIGGPKVQTRGGKRELKVSVYCWTAFNRCNEAISEYSLNIDFQ